VSAHAIRPIAICVFRRNDSLFVFEGHDWVKGETFYRPLGGGIEFGEYGIQATAREIREEIGEEVANLRYLGTLENIFTCNGKPGHEIVQVYEGEFADRRMYERESMEGREDCGTPFKAMWKPLADFQRGHAPLYPDGLLQLLERDSPQRP